MSDTNDLPHAVQGSWQGFLASYEPLRADLYRYCRHLTRSPWDAEDLVQDTLGRAFVTLAQMGHSPPNPRAWLFRVASNLWIDRLRARRREQPLDEQAEPAGMGDPRRAREAAGTLFGQLSPQERAAVVLKDACGLSLEDVADVLTTSVGAIKAALHRGREKLVGPPAEPAALPAPGVLDAFCVAYNAGDLERLAELLLDSASVEVVSATTQYGREAARRTVLYGMLFGYKRMAAGDPTCGMPAPLMAGALDRPPRAELREHRGGWVILHWYAHRDGEAVRALTCVDVDDAGVSRLRNYFYTPELIAEVCAELGVPSRPNGYRYCVSQ